MGRTTRTYAILKISAVAYQEIIDKLRAAGYAHAFIERDPDPAVDMHGIAVSPEKGCLMPSHHWSCDCKGEGGNR